MSDPAPQPAGAAAAAPAPASDPTPEPAPAPTTTATTDAALAKPGDAPVAAESKPTETSAPAAEPTSAPKDAAAPAQAPFDKLAAQLPSILAAAEHSEMWGVELSGLGDELTVPARIVLQKFLNANEGDPDKAAEQLGAALKFRKEKKPLELVNRVFSKAKFENLGLVTWYDSPGSKVPEVFTWNLYGNVKDRMDEVFVPLEEFMDYRIALQELGLQKLDLTTATEPITADGPDPYRVTQVHDYKGVSFFRQNPNVRAASQEVIKTFSTAYPELLKEKFFVNVPAIMGWLYTVIKVFVAEKTAKKFHPMANGANLAVEFGPDRFDAKTLLPKEYGGANGTGDGTLVGLTGNVANVRLE